MNVEEFKTFLGGHLARFPQLQKEQIDKDSWWQAMQPFEIDDALEASSMMLSGEIKRPFYASDHVSCIVNHCRMVGRPSSVMTNAKENGVGVDCCQQSGIRKIYHPEDIMRLLVAARPDDYNERARAKYAVNGEVIMRTSAVACDCEIGYARFSRTANNPWPHFGDRYWHVEFDENLTNEEIIGRFLAQRQEAEACDF